MISFKSIRKFCRDWHRDLGYFFAGLTLLYALSGIALNHHNEWDPNFILTKKEITLDRTYTKSDIDESFISEISRKVDEQKYKLYDFSTPTQLKIYYQNASLILHLDQKKGIYEKVSKRPVIYHANLLHLNSIDYWRWFSDIFCLALMFLSVSGLIIVKGKYGFSKRGCWLFLLGFLPPILALVFL